MTLREMKLRSLSAAAPRAVQHFLLEADRRIERFQQLHTIPGFVPSDYPVVYRCLRSLAEAAVAPGSRFCEWGSGFGVVTCLAAMIGFDACGLEIEAQLVDEARRLAADFEVPVEFVCGSFIPIGANSCWDQTAEFAWLNTEAADTSAELGLVPEEIDVVFAYPWPDEERLTARLFEHCAAVGAVLVTYHGGDDIRLRKKTGRR